MLSAYTPINVYGTNWAMMAEVEALVNALQMYILIVALFMVVGVVTMAIIVSTGLLRTLGNEPEVIAGIADKEANGDLDLKFEEGKAERSAYTRP
ncbi:hypothetical protein LF599_12020 [Pseudodesulfovibrio thermohalotolerans]|uniref:hypothetical protein n=1 Tax=Pseudodesulfovibrio thermohalotolerans TaxID=2880651 RepID=UPI0022BA053F|nr:hypothetical protein [Pseudodesulfovibrio thermohalotolerans]WFS61394.1 hypothetical protein LF599_12020 [Pseudodesulfovibrio thermohalotolerans]